MKVLVCHNYYREHGGENVAVPQQVDLLRRNGHEVILFERRNSEIQAKSLWGKIRFPVETINSRTTYRCVRELVRRERPDVAHVHNVFPLISPSLYCALSDEGVPLVQTVHNYRFLCPNALFYTHGSICEKCKYGMTLHAVRYRCYRSSFSLSAIYAAAIGLHRKIGTFDRIDKFIALTDFSAAKLVESGLAKAEKVVVIGNCVRSQAGETLVSNEAPYAIFVGRLTPEKGVGLLLDAFLDLPSIGLKIIGDGPELPSLAERITRSGRSHIQLMGFIDGPEKWRILGGAAFSVVPSLWYESLPFSALESFSCGVPVLTSNHGGLGAIVSKHSVGDVFRAGDPASLRESAVRLMSAPVERERMSRAARALADRDYSEQGHYERLEGAYRSVMPKSLKA